MKRGQFRSRGRPRKTNGPGAETILTAALDVFATNGFDETTLRAVATKAGVDVALIPYHFGSKLGLWKAVIGRFAEISVSALTTSQEQAEGQTPTIQLQMAMHRLIDLVSDQPLFAKFLIRELASAKRSERQDFIRDQLIRPTYAIVAPITARIDQDSGSEACVDRDLVFFVALGGIAMAIVQRELVSDLVPAFNDPEILRRDLKRMFAEGLPARRTG